MQQDREYDRTIPVELDEYFLGLLRKNISSDQEFEELTAILRKTTNHKTVPLLMSIALLLEQEIYTPQDALRELRKRLDAAS